MRPVGPLTNCRLVLWTPAVGSSIFGSVLANQEVEEYRALVDGCYELPMLLPQLAPYRDRLRGLKGPRQTCIWVLRWNSIGPNSLSWYRPEFEERGVHMKAM